MKNSVGILGKKVGMTQVFDKEGSVVPVTVVQLGENIVTQKLTAEKNGYTAVQIGGFVVKETKLNKPERGGQTKQNLPPLKPLKEFRVKDSSAFNVGEELKPAELFAEGTLVDVQGRTIGKGFQGTIKRYHAGRGPMSHGSKFHRSMGSIGPGTTPGRTFKGLHMPGQMGNVTATVRHLTVVSVDTEKRLMLIRGTVPGAEGGLLVITPSVTKWNAK
ncbi:MAG: 50S ribosomal protein L3 [Candidatus Obscuribacterales bacterium]